MILYFCSSALRRELDGLVLNLDLTSRLNVFRFTLTRSLIGFEDVEIDCLKKEFFLQFWFFY
jgi:hypothetical protein